MKKYIINNLTVVLLIAMLISIVHYTVSMDYLDKYTLRVEAVLSYKNKNSQIDTEKLSRMVEELNENLSKFVNISDGFYLRVGNQAKSTHINLQVRIIKNKNENGSNVLTMDKLVSLLYEITSQDRLGVELQIISKKQLNFFKHNTFFTILPISAVFGLMVAFILFSLFPRNKN